MINSHLAVITDRGGHLHNALQLLAQMDQYPANFVSGFGPDVDALRADSGFAGVHFHRLPELFSWFGKKRFLNPFQLLFQIVAALTLALRIRPRVVLSLGASNVVFFCYFTRLLGARVYHVECMNQVIHPSITGRMLYPICSKLYVQWPSLLKAYGEKAAYEGWVL